MKRAQLPWLMAGGRASACLADARADGLAWRSKRVCLSASARPAFVSSRLSVWISISGRCVIIWDEGLLAALRCFRLQVGHLEMKFWQLHLPGSGTLENLGLQTCFRLFEVFKRSVGASGNRLW